jgi:hypothetical protein
MLALLLGATIAVLLIVTYMTFTRYPQRSLAETKAYGKLIADDRGPVLKKAMEKALSKE